MSPLSPFESPKTKHAIMRHVQQSLAPALGAERAEQACVPTAIYMLAEANGYINADQGPDLLNFVERLDWEHDFKKETGWLRPYLTKSIRNAYGFPIVSWIVSGNTKPTDHDIQAMHASGYIGTPEEEAFFKERVVGREIKDIVDDGYPVIVSVKPGFGANSSSHAVVVVAWDDHRVEVLDPDDRNMDRVYDAGYVEEHINPIGGCTVILPPR